MLHKKCGSRLKQQYICPKDDEIVPRSDISKGYEFSKGQYVMFSDDELKALQERATHALEITEFLPTAKVDPIYFEKTYYLGPDKGGDRAYKLLAQALRESGRSAIAKYAARGKQYLVLLRPVKDALVMQQLRYADEIRSISEVPLGDAQVKPGELKLALQIVDQAVSDTFRPEGYEDEVRQRILAQIEKKVEGQEITVEPEEEPKAVVIDLMQALKSSLARKAGDRRPAKRSPGKTARAKPATSRKVAGKRAK
jgi:DNA end-binding protein Ku